ncbi:hypothetical protein [Pseudomonas sp. RIT-PI-AD]|uniref:hypothetical protein n=1 Tax=Pseudomonas sp. RIT-PI-AD TaxID=3035294 RepID=UPI0021DAE352|nr:hypothetical protein [Pseudomonas sp. RIT-PI-AD]
MLKVIKVFGLFNLSIMAMIPMKAFPYEKFPVRPLDGMFEVISSDPSVENVSSDLLGPEIFYLNQRVKFSYVGPVGFDWPMRDEYKITLYPPFLKRYCNRPGWEYICESELTEAPLVMDGMLDTERLKIDMVKSNKYLSKYLNKPAYHFVMTYSDERASYDFYMLDWNTLIYSTAYSSQSKKSEDDDFVSVIQILRRVKE